MAETWQLHTPVQCTTRSSVNRCPCYVPLAMQVCVMSFALPPQPVLDVSILHGLFGEHFKAPAA